MTRTDRVRDDRAAAGAAADPRPAYAVVGAIVTRAPEPALLAVLRALRPEYDVRLEPGSARSSSGLRRHEISVRVPVGAGVASTGAIAVWLRIKSALMAEFPADHANAVMPIDPHPPPAP